MNKPIEGEPAFPSPPVGTGDPRDGMTTGHPGMSLREWYIGKALQGFCANPKFAHAAAEDLAFLAIHQAAHIMEALHPQPKETEQ